MFNKLAAVAADASLSLQICGPKPHSFYNGNVHYKMEGVFYITGKFTSSTEAIVQPNVMVFPITTNSITLSWSEVTGTARYYVSYERTDLSISLTPTYIRLVGSSNTTLTIPGLEPGAMYRIRVWASSNSARASSPHEIHLTTNEDG